ncbi:MAG: DcaP family trimeric outer membrane transporter [Casimicrobiaceae bacterium]
MLKQQLQAIQQRIERLERSQATQQKAQKELQTRVDEGTVSPATVVTAGDFKGSFKLPGTDTSFSIFGYFWGSVLVRNIRIDQPGATDNQWGAALQLGGIIPITSAGRDDFRFVINYGNVVGRYQELGFFPDGILVNNQIELSDVVSGFVSYRHFWSPNWRSNLVLSASYADHPGGTAATINKEARSAHLNLIWSSIASVNLGVEYIYGYRRTQNGFSGNLNRLKFSGQYSF